jgi:hypothetical protein
MASKRKATDKAADDIDAASAAVSVVVATKAPAAADVVPKRPRSGGAGGNDPTLVVASAVPVEVTGVDPLDAALSESLGKLPSAVQEPARRGQNKKAGGGSAAANGGHGGAPGGSTPKADRLSRWELHYNNLIAYIAERGNARVPQSLNTDRCVTVDGDGVCPIRAHARVVACA